MRGGIYEQFTRMTTAERAIFGERLRGDQVARRHVTTSFLQRRGWRHGVPVSRSAFRFGAVLDLDALRAAFGHVCQRHEVLRSRFLDLGGELIVLVGNDSGPFTVIDQRLSPGEADAALHSWLSAPFDLSMDSPVRCLAIVDDHDATTVAFAVHGMVADDRSIDMLLDELAQAYQALRTGRPPALPAQSLQHIDYAVWEQERWTPDRVSAEVDHRREAMDGVAHDPGLLCERPASGEQKHHRSTAVLPSPTAAGLARIGAPQSAVFHAIFAVALRRIAQHDDFLIGTPSTIANLIGPLTGTAALRTDLTGDPAFSALAGRLAHAAQAAFAQPGLPFERFVDRHPPLRVIFHHGAPAPEFTLDGVVGARLPLDMSTGECDLSLSVRQSELTLEHAAGLFDAIAAQDFLLDILRIAKAVAADPDLTVAALLGAPTPPASRAVLEQRLLDICRQELGSDQLRADDNFFEAGGTSHLLISMQARIAEQLGHTIDLIDLYEFPTVWRLTERIMAERTGPRPVISNMDGKSERRRAGLARLAQRRRGASANAVSGGPRWLLNRTPRPQAPLRLYCFPHSGGATVGEFLSWGEHLTSAEVWGLQLPGRGSRVGEDPVSSLTALAATIADEVEFQAPYAILGHSSGALLAFEVARAIQRQGLVAPRRLYISACIAPTLIRREDVPISTLEDADFIREVERIYGTLPPEIHHSADLMRIIVASWRADMASAEEYEFVPGPPLACPITATGGRSDYENELRLGPWAQQTSSAFDLTMFDGDHFYFRQDPAAWFEFLNGSLAADLQPSYDPANVLM